MPTSFKLGLSAGQVDCGTVKDTEFLMFQIGHM